MGMYIVESVDISRGAGHIDKDIICTRTSLDEAVKFVKQIYRGRKSGKYPDEPNFVKRMDKLECDFSDYLTFRISYR